MIPPAASCAFLAQAAPAARFWQHRYLDNEVWRFLLLLGSVLAGLVIGRLVRYALEHAGRRASRRDQERQGQQKTVNTGRRSPGYVAQERWFSIPR